MVFAQKQTKRQGPSMHRNYEKGGYRRPMVKDKLVLVWGTPTYFREKQLNTIPLFLIFRNSL